MYLDKENDVLTEASSLDNRTWVKHAVKSANWGSEGGPLDFSRENVHCRGGATITQYSCELEGFHGTLMSRQPPSLIALLQTIAWLYDLRLNWNIAILLPILLPILGLLEMWFLQTTAETTRIEFYFYFFSSQVTPILLYKGLYTPTRYCQKETGF